MEAAYQYVLEKINMGMTIMGMYRQDVYELPTDSIFRYPAMCFS